MNLPVITARLVNRVVNILTAVKSEIVQQMLGFGAVKIMVGMAAFAAVGNDKGVLFDLIAFAITGVGVGDERTDQVPARLEAALDFCHRLLNDLNGAVVDHIPGDEEIKEVVSIG